MAAQGSTGGKRHRATKSPQIKNLPILMASVTELTPTTPACAGKLLLIPCFQRETAAYRKSMGYIEKKWLYNSVLKH